MDVVGVGDTVIVGVNDEVVVVVSEGEGVVDAGEDVIGGAESVVDDDTVTEGVMSSIVEGGVV